MKMGVKNGKPMMWSKCVCVRNTLVLIGPRGKSFFMMCPASSRTPDPRSMTISLSSSPNRSSRQEVLPPYFTVVGPGTGIEPRTPQKVKRMDTTAPLLGHAQEDLGLVDLAVGLVLHRLQVIQRDAQLFEHVRGQLFRVAVAREPDLVGVGEKVCGRHGEEYVAVGAGIRVEEVVEEDNVLHDGAEIPVLDDEPAYFAMIDFHGALLQEVQGSVLLVSEGKRGDIFRGQLVVQRYLAD